MRDLTAPLFKYAFKVYRKFPEENVSEDIRWICYALDLVHPRDTEETLIQVFRTLIEGAKEGRGLTTTEISEKLGVTRGTVLNHLKRLLHRHIIIQNGMLYELREHSLSHTIERIREDVTRYVEDMLDVSRSIDRFYELQARKSS